MKKGGMLRSLSLGILITSLLIPVSILAQDGTSSTVETSLSTVADSDTSISPATTEPLVTETPISTTSELLPDTTQETREVSTEEEGSLVPESAQVSIPIYRLYHPGIGRHLYTTDENEKNIRYNEGWGYEGIAWYAPGQGTPVYRLYNATLKNHLYTQDRNEVRVLTSLHGWKSDFNGQPVFYSGGEISVYRLYNRNLQGRHHWTTDTNEYRVLPSHGWTQEGIKFKALQIGKPIQTQYKENIPSGSADISNTPSRVTIEADVSLSGTGTGYHAKLVMATSTSAVSFGIQFDQHARAPHTGKASFMVENILHNNTGGQEYFWTNYYARSGSTYRLMLTLQNDGTYTGYINGAMVISGRNSKLAGVTVYPRVEGAARKDGDSINANFTNIKLKDNGSYQANRRWTGTPRFNINNSIVTKINGQIVPNTAAGDRLVTNGINISGRLTGLPSFADWDTAGYYDKVSGLIQFY